MLSARNVALGVETPYNLVHVETSFREHLKRLSEEAIVRVPVQQVEVRRDAMARG